MTVHGEDRDGIDAGNSILPRAMLALALLLTALAIPACRHKPSTTSPATTRPAGPAALVLGRRFLDLGALRPGSTRTVRVAIRNDGAGELVIGRVETGCECIRASMANKRIAPGRSELLVLEVRTLDHHGPYRGTIAIASNAPAGLAVLTVLFDVPRPISLAPPALYLGVLKPGAEAVKTVKLVAAPGVATKLLYATGPDPSVTGRVISANIAAGKDGVAEVAVRAPDRPGLYRPRLAITTALPDRPTISVAVVFTVSATAAVTPARIDFGRFGRGQQPKRTLHVTPGPGVSVQSAIPHPLVLNVTILGKKGKKGAEHLIPPGQIAVTVSPKPQAPYGPLDGELRIRLDGAEPNTLVVPFTGYVAEATP